MPKTSNHGQGLGHVLSRSKPKTVPQGKGQGQTYEGYLVLCVICFYKLLRSRCRLGCRPWYPDKSPMAGRFITGQFNTGRFITTRSSATAEKQRVSRPCGGG